MSNRIVPNVPGKSPTGTLTQRPNPSNNNAEWYAVITGNPPPDAEVSLPKISHSTLILSLYKAGLLIPPKEFHKCRSNPSLLERYISLDNLKTKVTEYHDTLLQDEKAFLPPFKAFLLRQTSLTFCFGFLPMVNNKFIPDADTAISRRRRKKFFLFGMLMAILTSFVYACGLIAYVTQTLSGVVLVAFTAYSIYFSIQFAGPLSLGQWQNKRERYFQRSLYFSKTAIRYEIVKLGNEQLFGEEALEELCTHDHLAAMPPIHVQRVREQNTATENEKMGKRDSISASLKDQERNDIYSNPRARHVLYAFIAAIHPLIIAFPRLTGNTPPGTDGWIRITLEIILSICVFFGMHATFAFHIDQAYEVYSSCAKVTRRFRKNTTLKAVKSLEEKQYGRSERLFTGKSEEDTGRFDIFAGNNLEVWWKMYSYVLDEVEHASFYHHAKVNVFAFTAIVMAGLLLLSSFKLNRSTMTLNQLSVFALFGCLTIFHTVLVFALLRNVLQINRDMHKNVLSDLKTLVVTLRKEAAGDDIEMATDRARLIDQINRIEKIYIATLEEQPRLVGKILTLKVTPELVKKACGAVVVSTLSAAVRVGLK